MEIWQRVVDHWKANDLDVPPGASPAAIQDFEGRYGVRLPAVLRDYFMTANGNGDEWGRDLFQFYPLERVKPVYEEIGGPGSEWPNHPLYFAFADYSIWCFGYAVLLSEDVASPCPVYLITSKLVPAQPIAGSTIGDIATRLGTSLYPDND